MEQYEVNKAYEELGRWGVGKTLAVQAYGPECDPQDPLSRQAWKLTPVTTVPGRGVLGAESRRSWGSLAIQANGNVHG